MRTQKLRYLRRMSSGGDTTLYRWNPETVTEDELQKIEAEYQKWVKQGWFAANLMDNTLIREFDPQADILLIPRVQGGRT
jgi:hypothetical protein